MRRALYVVALLLFMAGVLLYVLTERTDRFFAWTIEPPLTAATLGAFYWGSSALVLLAVRTREWAHVRVILPGIFVITALTLVATLVHIDRFHFPPGEPFTAVVTWGWVVIYAGFPLVLATLVVLQVRSGGSDPPSPPELPKRLRVISCLVGAAIAGLGVALFAVPERVLGVWPWALTPLTARAVAAWLVGVGVVLMVVMRDGVWRTLVAPSGSGVVLAVLQLLALARYGSDVDWGRPATWVYASAWLTVGAAGVYGIHVAARRLVPAGRGSATAAAPAPGVGTVAGRGDLPSTKPIVDKLGVKPGARVSVLGVDDAEFLAQLAERTPNASLGRRRVRSDVLVAGFERREDLVRLGSHKDFIAPDGMVWAVWPKGSKAINENDVRDMALEVGLVDVKVASFSDTLSALKLVYRLVDRPR